jgi:class 3 adenylate cyclase/TolB-like protein/Tfp pilus assembly protein PilF
MAEARVERRLAAILAADVAGYSRLMGADEVDTLKGLTERRTILDRIIEDHRGRIANTAGDSVLAEFGSAVDAVQCAVDAQTALAEANSSLPPDRRISFRIGIHIGDVMVRGGDLFGDGVNIAARLQSIAKPGGVCISGATYDQVRKVLPITFADLGPQHVKNIQEPIRAYEAGALGEAKEPALALSHDTASAEVGKPQAAKPASLKSFKAAQPNWLPILAAIVLLIVITSGMGLYFAGGPKSITQGASQPITASTSAELTKQVTPEPPKVAPERLSIVVLPFANLSGDPAKDYIADVITDGLTTNLSRIANSFVIDRSTAFTYKGKPVDVRLLGRDLGVRYVLEGSAQLVGSLVRVSAQLIDAESGKHLWTDQFDANLSNLLEMQDEIIKRLAGPLELRLIDVEAARIARTPPANLHAQDLALQCMAGVVPRLQIEGNLPAFDFCKRAVQLDESNAIALTFLSLKYSAPVLQMQSTDRQTAIRQAAEFAARALAADPNFYWAHLANAAVLISQKHHEEAIVELEQTVALNPGFTTAYGLLCEANNYLGRPDIGMEYVDKAIRHSPRDPQLSLFYGEKAWALLMLQKDDLAIEWLRRTLKIKPDIPVQYALLASTLALTGRQAEASEALQRYLSLKATTSKTIAEFRPQHRAASDNPKWLAYSDRLVEGLRKAGMPEG